MRLLTTAAPIFMAVVGQSAAGQGTASASENKLRSSFTTGLTYSAGDYGGGTKIEVASVPATLRAVAGPFRLSARMPYLRVTGPGRIIGGGEGGPIIIDPGQSPRRQARSGFGDLNLGASYGLGDIGLAGLTLDLSGSVKLPTSSARKGFGTGKTDVFVSADLALPSDKFTPFASIGYRLPGDPADLNLRNSFTTSLGATAKVGPAYVTGSYDYAGATSEFVGASHSLFAAVSRSVGPKLNLTGFGLLGLSDGSADFGAGLLVRVTVF